MPTTNYWHARRFAVAPMLAYTNRHARYFYRILSPDCLLYTEMLHINAVLGKKGEREIAFDPREKPLVVQLAGNDQGALLEAGFMCQDRGYDAINLNIGCPSNKVRMGAFGACLMAKPREVANQVSLLKQHLTIPITVKCRLGIDDQDYTKTLPQFVKNMCDAGCDELIIHARKALLRGLNPKQNRIVPALDYSFVQQLAPQFPRMHITINGGIQTLRQAQQHLQYLPGVMLGRAILDDPMILRQVATAIFSCQEFPRSTIDYLKIDYAPYIAKRSALGDPSPPLLRPIIHLFRGQPGAAKYRRILSDHQQQIALGTLLEKALDCLQSEQASVRECV